MDNASLHLVIRSVEERTFEYSRRLAESQLEGKYRLSVVQEYPFEEALRKSYQIGLDSGCDWLMTLDADVLLKPGAVSELLGDAQRMPRHFFQLEGWVFDRITGGFRQAGHRIYRVSMLGRAIGFIPGAGEEIRPESSVVKRMGGLGHPTRIVPRFVGLHDFEQFYCDLYRKSFLHAKKHDYLIGTIIRRCQLEKGDESSVILKGLWDGLNREEKDMLNAPQMREMALHAISSIPVWEREALPGDGESAFDRIVNRQNLNDAGLDGFDRMLRFEKWQNRIHRWGREWWGRFRITDARSLIGRSLIRAGRWIQ